MQEIVIRQAFVDDVAQALRAGLRRRSGDLRVPPRMWAMSIKPVHPLAGALRAF